MRLRLPRRTPRRDRSGRWRSTISPRGTRHDPAAVNWCEIDERAGNEAARLAELRQTESRVVLDELHHWRVVRAGMSSTLAVDVRGVAVTPARSRRRGGAPRRAGPSRRQRLGAGRGQCAEKRRSARASRTWSGRATPEAYSGLPSTGGGGRAARRGQWWSAAGQCCPVIWRMASGVVVSPLSLLRGRSCSTLSHVVPDGSVGLARWPLLPTHHVAELRARAATGIHEAAQRVGCDFRGVHSPPGCSNNIGVCTRRSRPVATRCVRQDRQLDSGSRRARGATSDLVGRRATHGHRVRELRRMLTW
jgi:hypothetical protein